MLPPDIEDAALASGLLAGPGSSPPHLAAIRAAMQADEKVRLSYVDKRSRASERVVWPVAVGFFDTGEMLAAWCETRGAFRHFRLDRIEAAASTGERMPMRRRVLLADWRLDQELDD